MSKLWVCTIAAWLCTSCQDDEGGCQPEVDVDNDVDPTGGTLAELVPLGEDGLRIWQVRWDNPVVGDPSFALSGESAIRDGNTWAFNRFDLWANWATFGGLPPEQVTGALTWPQFDGTYNTFLWWEMHGLRLQPRLTGAPLETITQVQAVREGCDGQPALYKGDGLFQLAPDVALVPVRVVVFHPDDGSVPADWFSVEDAELLLDDVWRGTKTRKSGSGCFTNDVDGVWTHRAGCAGEPGCETLVQASSPDATTSIIQPDRIWDQCGVQFRMIAYHQCEIRRGLFNPVQAPNDGLCGIPDPRMRELRNTSVPDCGIQWDPTAEVMLMFTGRLEPLSCTQGTDHQDVTFGLHDGGAVAVTGLGVEQRGLVAAHEIGHALGLDDLEGCANDDLLMCFSVFEQGGILSDQECETANMTAREKQANFWGSP